MEGEVFDFVVVGAGMSGINAGYRLKTRLPGYSYTILEAHDTLEGTWSYFKFPGVRSDSKLTSFGFPWRPRIHNKDIVQASLIIDYLQSAADDEGIDKNIQFGHKMISADWSSSDQLWTIRTDLKDGTTKTFRCTFVLNCTGYYSYEKPLKAEIPETDKFTGVVAHPQFWPESINLSGQVVLVGSGATAITMLPALAKTATHVTMLQRSPSHVFSIPSESAIGKLLKSWLPARVAHRLNWWQTFILGQLFVAFHFAYPKAARCLHMSLMKKQLPPSVPVSPHFDPRYAPMEQRLCMCPDGDFFKAFHRDNCDIATDTIDTLVEHGILTKSGRMLDADVIVTATGLHLVLFGGVIPTVGGTPLDIGKSYCWRGAMTTGLPNMRAVVGYTTSPWTLGADTNVKLLISVYKEMKRRGATSAMPVFDGDPADSKPMFDHSSTYFVSALDRLPVITGEAPWYGRISPSFDFWQRRFGSLTKGMRYTVPERKKI
jgi:cation diffusion facilitator CzcD-associated flavoprotein CzcO